MLKKIFTVLKKIIISAFILYGYNLLAMPLNITIPINIFTVLSISLLGLPALFSLIFIFILVY